MNDLEILEGTGFLDQAIAGFSNQETETLGINNIPSSDVTSGVSIPTQTTDDSDALLLPNNPSILNVSGLAGKDLLTGEIAFQVSEQLKQFAADPNFSDKMNLAFGDSWNVETANAISQQWLAGDFSQIPEIEVVSTDDIAGADGAFAGATETIYISQEWLELNASNPGEIASVVLEEIGHYFDYEINIVDAAGDEGAIFSAVVRGEELTATEVAVLKAEDDSAVAVIDGQEISIEKFDFENQWYVKAYRLEDWKQFSIDIDNNFGSNTLSNGQKGFSGNWGQGSPRSAIPDDDFVLELFTQANFEAGKTYTFNVRADDGYWITSLPVDGGNTEVITDPRRFSKAYGGNTHVFTPDTTGKYWIATIYYERGGDAYFDLAWSAEEVSQVSGTARNDDGEEKNISIQSIDGAAIEPNTPTWLVIHGNASNSGNMGNLANAVKSDAPDDHQVLTLDWSSAANNDFDIFNPESWVAGLGESTPWIQPVAETAKSMLSNLGISGDNLNLIGHSLGSYVSWEIANMNSGGVNNVIALDPATDVPGWYETRNIDFSEVSDNSWAFVGSPLGSIARAHTAEESFQMQFFSLVNPFEQHRAVHEAFADFLRSNTELGGLDIFTLKNMGEYSFSAKDGFEWTFSPIKSINGNWYIDSSKSFT
ncbi:MAG: hypothetical protein F6K54_18065 [Okeania sp. SIO3B5]|uniref:hypothetical protein n=1 Tax=Okeania sp. SIO3B5 TaxID=2607811 RepID=UPI0013FE9CB7|nr:hypothetical protein [Okeania sp. SIO3B5]NEO54819.1 hypothetical protein [Okeania sp. SIO3B5]